MPKERISIVWLKRDLRLQDNEAIYNALQSGHRVLFLYVFEKILMEDPHYSERHWNFIKDSIADMNEKLAHFKTQVLTVEGDLVGTFNRLQETYVIDGVYSHRETGLLVTFDRDKKFARYCRNHLIAWIENNNNGVERGLKNREDWFERWNSFMEQPQIVFDPPEASLLTRSEITDLATHFSTASLETLEAPFQKGGTTQGWKYAKSFFQGRHREYMFHISKPGASRKSCSRLSPYLAWGNLSVREIYQYGKKVKSNVSDKRHLGAFLSRLRWQAHFIQKFEMEHTMEQASVNKGYHKLKKQISLAYQKAWREGNTGFPLVDASMRCLNTTGYLNFRMRAMLASFFTHILWQPWQDATQHLSQQFLDFEPGIHFPQLQMQAGETGINNLRIYNPIKNAKDHDPEGDFIKKWVPELARLDIQFVHEPYLMTPMEQQLYDFKLGRDYPKPIVEIKETRKRASDVLWGIKKDPEVKKESLRILKKHTIPNRNRMLRNE
ncbi:FAD-binding domain-containing protein [Aureisphaera galaxeae]|uniref:cryptochrome/deoxyribodipyrimidine photo-lyase family protein n=1 Tax=Aureisphaera galaxeae TaxID=1538023 RepID=UPI0023504306|nr:FAD-binding domain-containing protein [Aureisphaera galaxeae]MDC8006178.1 FAD-binding domain-containing protein [Aureisphaera galaxeae]